MKSTLKSYFTENNFFRQTRVKKGDKHSVIYY